ncbi:uncharacterized protein RJT20DRAFT_125911 [Scheffersomyces xylosifermentans]|uniref:uncharacterized protein n=1 Tax=Scheffersomyces xylosifermentans TaxID=1304137 RepID=UPI00315D72C6
MNKLTTISLKDKNCDSSIEDVQLWSNSMDGDKDATELMKTTNVYERMPFYINHNIVPVYLLAASPMAVFSKRSETSAYFKELLVKNSLQSMKSNANAILFRQITQEVESQNAEKSQENESLKHQNTTPMHRDVYLIFYYDSSSKQVKVLLVDFSRLDKFTSIFEKDHSTTTTDKSAFILLASSVRHDNRSTVFDKVLQRKKSRMSPFLAEAGPSTSSSSTLSAISTSNSSTKLVSSSILTTQEQIHQAINKIILSGLRIRGLSTNLSHSINDKLTIKEIYQMTHKATLFSLRKYSYQFISSSASSAMKGLKTTSKGLSIKNYIHPVRLSDLQDTIEKLLELFVDVGDPNTL